ncbi:MAG: DNA polymerase, partial [Devosiaceae bacterium]|nr:DNA polymerase [Devosiaceae bacterium]
MHLLLVDGSTFIFRAYHALPPLTRKSDGLPIGAVAGFCNMLFKLIDNFEDGETPTHMAVIFDHKGKTFRNDFFPSYKANRPPAPEDLVPQFPLTREATKAFSILSVEQAGFEADDLIATYTNIAKKAGAKVTIISTDKDLMQLVNDEAQIKMFDSIKNRYILEEQVIEKFGVSPNKVIEVQSLAGDSVDNVPGVPGIGIKTAAQLIGEYGDLENLLNNASEIKQNKRRENLIEFAEQAKISHRLVTLKQDVPVEQNLEDFKRQPIEANNIVPFLKAMDFNSLLRRVGKVIDADIEAFEADENLAAPVKKAVDNEISDENDSPKQYAKQVQSEIAAIDVNYDNYETISNIERLKEWVKDIYQKGHVAIDCETTGLDNQVADLVGICLSVEMGKACYIPLGHKTLQDDMFGSGLLEGQIEMQQAIDILKPMLEDKSVLKILQNAKYDMGILSRYNMDIVSFDDTMLLSYAIDGARGNSMDALSQRWLDHTPIAFKDIAGVGKKQISFDRIEIAEASKYASEDADITLRLWHILKARLIAKKATNVYETLERPLVSVLAKMEARGICVDREILANLSNDFAARAAKLQKQAHQIAEQEFNLASPKQLGEILYEKMGLTSAKKTKTGAYATGVAVLEDLAAKIDETKGSALAKVILQWRGVSKLKSTYSDALPTFINARTNRVHTS